MSDAIKPVAWSVFLGEPYKPLYDQSAIDAAVAAERDCRTCRNFSTHSGGCVSVLRCTNANAYKRAGVIQYWETTPENADF